MAGTIGPANVRPVFAGATSTFFTVIIELGPKHKVIKLDLTNHLSGFAKPA